MYRTVLRTTTNYCAQNAEKINNIQRGRPGDGAGRARCARSSLETLMGSRTRVIRDAMRAGVDRGVGRRRGAWYARTSVGGRRIAFSRYPKLERAVEGGTGDGRRRDGGDGRRRDGGDGRRWDARRDGARGYRRIRCAVDGFRASERPRGRCRSSDRSNARLNDRPIARGVRRRAWPEVG